MKSSITIVTFTSVAHLNQQSVPLEIIAGRVSTLMLSQVELNEHHSLFQVWLHATFKVIQLKRWNQTKQNQINVETICEFQILVVNIKK